MIPTSQVLQACARAGVALLVLLVVAAGRTWLVGIITRLLQLPVGNGMLLPPSELLADPLELPVLRSRSHRRTPCSERHAVGVPDFQEDRRVVSCSAHVVIAFSASPSSH